MKKLLALAVLAAAIPFGVATASSPAHAAVTKTKVVHVKGHFTKNGTWVRAHKRVIHVKKK